MRRVRHFAGPARDVLTVGHARWPAIASIMIFLAIGNQISLGYERELAVHVPLGVAVFGAQTATALSLLARRSRMARAFGHAGPVDTADAAAGTSTGSRSG